ncbi:MAG: amidohydrolase family protein [Anaerolineaceae bacterium]|nr:amidohydrolase family protein [Anaerolineaceae bacterium]
MTTLLVRHAERVVTMDDSHPQIFDGGVFIRDNVIQQVAPTDELPATADRVIEARGQIVLPGLINTHHHLFQSLTRAYPPAQNAGVSQWIEALAPLWDRLTPDGLYLASKAGLAELLLSGCTTTADHLYYLPPACRVADEIAAVEEIGMRLHLCIGQSPPPASLFGSIEHAEVLRLGSETIEQFHDSNRLAMNRVALTGSLMFDPPDLQRKLIELADTFKVRLHSHMGETAGQAQACLDRFGHRLVEHAEAVGWLGENVWYAHGVHLNLSEIRMLAKTGTGIAHCPSSNMRLGSGIAPIVSMLHEGVPLSLGVDGSASNDSSHMLAELRQALLLQRVANGPDTISAETVFWMGTVGGARVLGRDDLGRLAPGMAADLVSFDLEILDFAGALHDPLAALVFCAPQKVAWSIVNGVMRVWEGEIVGLDLGDLLRRHRQASRALLDG